MLLFNIKKTIRKITGQLYKYGVMLLLYGFIMQANAVARQLSDKNTYQPVNTFPGPCIRMPLKLTAFGGKPNKDIVQLVWTTAAEKNVNHFELEKSTDGINFVFINKQTGKGIASGAAAYEAEDFRPSAGINYYRLKIVCNDGKFAYSKIIPVKHR